MSQAPENAINIHLALRWSDQDLLGHVNNAKIMTLVEEARVRTVMQLQQDNQCNGPLDMVLRTSQTEFLRPVMYTGDVEVNVWISRIGNTSFVMQHELVQDDAVCATVEAVVVMFDNAKQTPMTIPEHIRSALEAVSS